MVNIENPVVNITHYLQALHRFYRLLLYMMTLELLSRHHNY